MRALCTAVVLLLAACPPPEPAYTPRGALEVPVPVTAPDPNALGKLDDRLVDFAFDGGQLEFEMYRRGSHVVQVARNRFAVPIVIRWQMTAFDNVEPATATEGVAFLPAAPSPFGIGPNVVLGELDVLDPSVRYRRELYFRARFGDPRAVPEDYVYRLPYPAGLTFSVLQGFHGAFSHRGSNEYAVDFDCPVATPVLAARPGVVVAANAAAQGAGQTPEWLDYKRTNFVLVLHDDGTLGEYMHLSPSGIEVKPGQRVERGQQLGLSGNTGFSSTPHLHFQVMTAALDGVSARSFPFRLAVAPKRVAEPVQGQRYSAWE
ncbi:MAG TPA: M23 family metallopeptidase [Kofleriaceae bacterium]|nr:M23 family metallopeptidase [Kofleriaceae bacterium]